MPKGVYDRSQRVYKKHSEETKSKMAEKRKEYYKNMTEEEKAKRNKNWVEAARKTNTGRVVSDETRAKLSLLQTGRKKSIQEREKISKSCKGRKSWNEGKPWSPEMRDKIRFTTAKATEGRDWVEKPSKIELKIKMQLDFYKIKYVCQKSVCGGRFILDFYLPDYKLVIECNGDYWHNLDHRKDRDKRLEEFVKNKGKDILWLWEHKINEESFSILEYIEI